MESATAMILAGGRGTRMGILCQNRAKPALPFAGDKRVIDFTISNCIYSHIGNIAVLTDYQRSDLARYLMLFKGLNGKAGNLQILEPGNGHYRSTADAVYQNLDFIEARHTDQVMVLPSDHIYQMDYNAMLASHKSAGADLTVAVTGVPVEQAARFGNIVTDRNGSIVNYIEKPEIPQSNLISMGIFLFNTKVLCECLMEDANRKGSVHGFERAIIPTMLKRGQKVFAYQFDGYWRDIGNPRAYHEANRELILPERSLNLDNIPIFTGDNQPPTIETHLGSIENSLVSPGCTIKGQVENSILSPGVWVDEEAVVRDSVVMKNTFIGYHSVVDQCILDEDVNIGKFCYLGLEVAFTPGKPNITVVGKGVTVPSHTAIGRNCKIQPYAGPDDFTGKVITSNTTLPDRADADQLRTIKKRELVNV